MTRQFNCLAILTIVIWLGGFTACATPSKISDGVQLYKLNCASCHGALGQGGLASALGNASYLSKHDDAEIAQSIRDGVPGTVMRAWNKTKGGTLTDEQISDIVIYIRSLGLVSPR